MQFRIDDMVDVFASDPNVTVVTDGRKATNSYTIRLECDKEFWDWWDSLSEYQQEYLKGKS